MSKQSIYVKHKDEILSNLVSYLDDIAGRYEAVQSDYESGYITALKWVLGIDKTEKQKDKLQFKNCILHNELLIKKL